MTLQLFGTRGRDGTSVSLPVEYRSSVRWLPRIGDVFPDFAATTTHGTLRFRDWAAGKWVYFLSHPAAFDPVCTTEIAAIARNMHQFDARGVRLLSLSRDSVERQVRWIDELGELFDLEVGFPAVADTEGVLASACGMIHPHEDPARAIRKSFVIDPQRRVRMIFEYPGRVGRNIDEALRVIDALQAVDALDVATPGGWVPGEMLVVPSGMSDDEANERFGDRWSRLMGNLRVFQP